MRFDSIKDIDNVLMPKEFNPLSEFTTKDFGKLIWACPIIIINEKVSCNFIVPTVVKNCTDNRYIFFTPHSSAVDTLVEKTIHENKLSYTKVRYSFPYNMGTHYVSKNDDINNWDIALFDNPIECNEYRKQKEKEFRSIIKNDKDESKKYTLSIEDIETKFNIPHGKLIITGVWNDPYTKKKRKQY